MDYHDDDTSEPAELERQSRLGTLVIAVIVLIGTLVFVYHKPEDQAESIPSDNQLEEGWYDEVLSHLPPENIENPEETSSSQIKEPFSLPSLDDSDPVVLQKLHSLSHKHQLTPWIKSEFIIRRLAAVINGLSEGNIPAKLVNVPSPKSQFRIAKRDGKLWISENNYQRYDYLVRVFTQLNTNNLVKNYRIFHPLFQQAYQELGLPSGDIDQAIMSAIDQILSAPRLDTSVELKQDSVTYIFADTHLEALPPLQKLLIRIGPENTQKIQHKVIKIRTAFLANNGALK